MSCYFWPIFTAAPPVTLCHTSGDPQSTSHISDHPFLVGLVQKTRQKPLYKFSLNCSRGFCSGVLSGGLLSGRFFSGVVFVSPPSVRIHLLQQKVKHHFKFQVSFVR